MLTTQLEPDGDSFAGRFHPIIHATKYITACTLFGLVCLLEKRRKEGDEQRVSIPDGDASARESMINLAFMSAQAELCID